MLGFVRKVSVVAMYVGCCVPIVSLPPKHVAGMVYRQLHSDRHSTRPAFLIHSQKISKVKVYIFIEKNCRKIHILHSVANVYAVLPFYNVKCLCSGGWHFSGSILCFVCCLRRSLC